MRENGEISMRSIDLNKLLKEVIREAREANIPVPFNIDKEIKINKRSRKRFGCCHKKNNMFQIEISEFLLEAPEEKIKEALMHEVLHTCDRCFNHGSLWKSYANKVNGLYGYNIRRITSYEYMNVTQPAANKDKEKIKYIIKCEKCGALIFREKRSRVVTQTNRYRCKCGGKLVLM